jgi:hypothetical protein
MKTPAYFIISLLILLAACSKNEIVSPSGVSYQQSLNNWNSYKVSVNNNYTYTVTSGSVFGFGSETKITVKSGTVIGREYKATRKINNSPIDTVYKSWTETFATLNTHSSEGAEILNLDQVYAKAKTVWLTADKGSNDIYFETDKNGLISSCGYVAKGCQDDCFNGITIKEIVGL